MLRDFDTVTRLRGGGFPPNSDI
jgi:hypothetical protein